MKLFITSLFLIVAFTTMNAQSLQNIKNENFEVTYQSLKLYPNPVVTNAILEFQLNKSSNVQVTLLNILGAQVRNLINEARGQGRQSVQFSADQLVRGTYFVRLSIDGEIIKTIRVAVSPK